MEFFQFKPSSTVTIGPPGGTGTPHHGHHGHHGGPEHHLPLPHGPWVRMSRHRFARSSPLILIISPSPRLDSSTLPMLDIPPFGSFSPCSPSVLSVFSFSLLGSRGRLGFSTGTWFHSHSLHTQADVQALRNGPHYRHGLLLCHGYWTRYQLDPNQGLRFQPREPSSLPTSLRRTWV